MPAMNSITSRLPRWRGSGYKRCRPPSSTQPHFRSLTPSSLPVEISWRMPAAQIMCSCRLGMHSSPHCSRSFSVSYQPSLEDQDLSNEISHRNGNETNRDVDTHQKQPSNSPSSETLCYRPREEGPLVAPGAPLPRPLPKPTFSFRGRSLPPNLLAFSSRRGRRRFLESLGTDHAAAYFPLSQQFLNQMDPAYCGVTTLVLVLNALATDPNVRWRGGWRWYGDESMLLERCCLEEERVAREGITVEQYCGLARCQGVGVRVKRPVVELDEQGVKRQEKNERGGDNGDNHADAEEAYDVEELRKDIINAVSHPPRTHWDDAFEEEEVEPQHLILETTESQNTFDSATGGYFLVTSFARHALQQTGDGHFSPIAAYHPPTDSCLVLDVARFKYAPYWVSITELYDAMKPPDKSTGRPRGWILMRPPRRPLSEDRRTKGSMSKEELEGRRPVACVPLAGSGEKICPVERIKVDFCSVGKER